MQQPGSFLALRVSALACLLAGCVGTGTLRVESRAPHEEPDLVSAPASGPVRHRVEPGQTLYRIARTYGLSPEALADANGIKDARSVAVGQELLIPGVSQRLKVPPPGAPIPPPPSNVPERPAARNGERADSMRGDSPLAARASPFQLEARAGAPPRSVASSDLGRSRPATSAQPGQLRWPLRGVLYARFGKKGREPHDGIDLAAPEGTPVATADAGTVLFAGEQRGYGNIVIVQHGQGLITLYAHNRDLRVKTGQVVREGQVIATVGDSGKTSGPHLHFEVRQDGKPVDPLVHLGPIPERA